VFGLFPLLQVSTWLTYCYWDFSLSHAYVTLDDVFADNSKIDGSLSDIVDDCDQFKGVCPDFCDNSKKIRSAGDTTLAFGWISVLLTFLVGALIIFVWMKKGVSARILRFSFFVPSILFSLAGILYIAVRASLDTSLLKSPKTKIFLTMVLKMRQSVVAFSALL